MGCMWLTGEHDLSDAMSSPTHACFSLHFKHWRNKNSHVFWTYMKRNSTVKTMVQIWEYRNTNWSKRSRSGLDPYSYLQDEPSCPLIDLSDFEFERRKIDLAVPWMNGWSMMNRWTLARLGRFLIWFRIYWQVFYAFLTFEGDYTGESWGSTLRCTIHQHPEVW